MAAAEVIAFLRANTDEFTAKLDEAEAKMEAVSKAGGSNFDKLSSIGKYALLGIAGAAAGVAVASIDMADKYQAATNSIAANGDISIAKADQIGKAFLGTAGTTIYSAQNIASAFAGVAGQVKAMNGGVLNAKAAMDVMKPAMDLAEASGDSLAAATSDVTNTLQAFGLKITDSPLVSNVLFNAARVTGQSVDTLSGQLDKMKAKMGDAAPPIGQMGGLLVDLTEHGETGRAAMSALGSAFTGIISPTAAVTKAQQAMGVSFVNANGQLLPMDQIIGELAPKIAGMGNAQAAATLKSLGFGGASAKLVTTIESGPAVFDKATAAVTRQNSAHEAAEKQAQTLQHQVELVKATVEDYGVKIGQALMPKLEELLKIGLKVSEWLGKHKEVLIAVAVVIGGAVVAAIGAYTVAMISAAAATISASAPILAIIAVVALLAAGVIELIKHWSDVSGFFEGLWKDVQHIFDDAISFIVGIIKGWWPLILGIMTGGIGLLPALLVKYWSQIKSDVLQYWNDIVAFFQSVPSKVLAFFQSAASWLLNVGHDIIHGLWQGLQDEASLITGIGSTVLGWVTSAVSDAGSWLVNAGEEIIQGLVNGLGQMESFVLDKIKSIGSDIVGAFKSVLGISSPSKVFHQHGIDIMQGLANGMLAGSGLATGALNSVAGQLSGNFNAGITPYSGGGAPSGGSSAPISLNIDGQTFAHLILPALQTVVLQQQRSTSVPVFGTTQ